MHNILIEFPTELDDAGIAEVLREVAAAIESLDIESHELMDGSYSLKDKKVFFKPNVGTDQA